MNVSKTYIDLLKFRLTRDVSLPWTQSDINIFMLHFTAKVVHKAKPWNMQKQE